MGGHYSRVWMQLLRERKEKMMVKDTHSDEDSKK